MIFKPEIKANSKKTMEFVSPETSSIVLLKQQCASLFVNNSKPHKR